MTTTAIFRSEQPVYAPDQESQVHAERLRALGLTSLARQYYDDQADVPLLACYRRLSEDEHAALRAYAPTIYREGDFVPARALSHYTYADIPEDVMVEWELTKSLSVFDEYLIYTTEAAPRRRDPFLLGRKGDTYYLLAQWGEEAMVTLEDIVQRWRSRWQRIAALKWYGARAGMVFVASLILGTSAAISFDSPPLAAGTTLVSGASFIAMLACGIAHAVLDTRDK